MPVYVIGHRNPDTDAICSAIGYAEFLRESGRPIDAVPARCGEISERTAFALQKAGIPVPRLVLDVRLNIGSVCQRKVVSATQDESLYDAINRLRQHNLRGMPILDKQGSVLGLLSIQKALDMLLPGPGNVAQARIVETSLARIASVLGGTFQNRANVDREAPYILTVAALSEERFAKRLATYAPRDLVVVTGDRPNIHSAAIEHRVSCLIITGDNRLNDGMLRRAHQSEVNVLLSPHDTATTTLLVKCARRIDFAITREFVAFPEKLTVREAARRMLSTQQALFPVMDEENNLIGVLSRSDLVNPAPTHLILVDHNELSQAVSGAAECEILEVIDHHRIGGGLISSAPIRFINEPVGSTCTIVARTWKENGLTPPPGIALCLAAGLISDTLNLKSPTTTALDREMHEWLSNLVHCPLHEFARDFFTTGSPLHAHSPDEVVRADLKEYSSNGWQFAVAQVEEVELHRFWKVKEDLRDALVRLNAEKGMHFSCLLVTNITTQDSVLLAAGLEQIIEAIAFPPLDRALFELKGIVSRKKQLLPYLMRLIEEMHKEV